MTWTEWIDASISASMTNQKPEINSVHDPWTIARSVPGAEIGTWVWWVDQDRVELDAPQARLFGLAADQREISASWVFDRIDAVDRPRIEEACQNTLNNGIPIRDAFQFHSDDGSVCWLAARGVAVPVDDADGRRIVGVNFDVTEEKERIIHSDAVAHEMGHRVKNIITVIGGMVRMIDGKGLTAEEYKRSLTQRLTALAEVHQSIYRNEGVATVPEIARRVVFALSNREQVSIKGPPVVLNERAVQTLTMALTELTTNALKHGALRNENGKVDVAFELEEDCDEFQFIWTELTDQPISAPTHAGYGTLVLDRATAGTFDGQPRFEWSPRGLIYRCRWPLSRMTQVAPDA